MDIQEQIAVLEQKVIDQKTKYKLSDDSYERRNIRLTVGRLEKQIKELKIQLSVVLKPYENLKQYHYSFFV